ncbi:hypothetical protein T01_3212 [Trichinella spiralis]|uniref:Uncharacterized protein n=1 Tax=Trichinella spiralis TaxID=6334 RepID=A0A0V1BSY3_TRISP|nr:hypothetical protein T01_3212 [Trichinella spiralis]
MHPRCAIIFILSIFELPKISDDSEPTEAIREVLLQNTRQENGFVFKFERTYEMTTPVQQLIFAGLYSGRQFKVIGHLPLGAWLKQDDESSALCLHVQRLFHSLAAFAFHHTRLDVAVLEPKRLIAFKKIARVTSLLNNNCDTYDIDARVITIITNPLFVNVIRGNSIFIYTLNLSKHSKLLSEWNRKINELLEKFSFNTILLMVMMIEHLDKLVNRIFAELYAFALSLLALYRACMLVVMLNGNNGQESISSIIGRRIEERTHWKE